VSNVKASCMHFKQIACEFVLKAEKKAFQIVWKFRLILKLKRNIMISTPRVCSELGKVKA